MAVLRSCLFIKILGIEFTQKSYVGYNAEYYKKFLEQLNAQLQFK